MTGSPAAQTGGLAGAGAGARRSLRLMLGRLMAEGERRGDGRRQCAAHRQKRRQSMRLSSWQRCQAGGAAMAGAGREGQQMGARPKRLKLAIATKVCFAVCRAPQASQL